MSLKNRLLDAILDGRIGTGITVTRRELIEAFPEELKTYTGVLLSNSEMTTGTHSPTYDHFTERLSRGRYRIHPEALLRRLNERKKK